MSRHTAQAFRLRNIFRRTRPFHLLKMIAVIALIFSLSACMPPVKQYDGSAPALRLRTFFDGELKAWGMVQDWRGRVTRRFVVDMKGEWNGRQGTLTEHFVYDDGERQTRIWHLEELDDHRVRGRADDVQGEAQGEQYGAALNWQYTLALKTGDSTYNIAFDDWMVLVDPHHLLNRASLTYFGLPVGEVTLMIERLPTPP